MNAVWRDPLWWRYRIGNPLLATLPRVWQYRFAEHWGRWRARHANDAAVASQCALDLGVAKNESEAALISDRFYGFQSRLRLDDHRMAASSTSSVVEQIILQDADLLKDRAQTNHGLIVLTAHFGRLSMLAPAMYALGIKSSFLTATVDDRAQELSKMQRWVNARNALNQKRYLKGEWIMAADPATRLRAALRRGEPLVVVLDGFSTRSLEREEFKFCSGVIRVPTGIFRLSRITGAPMIFVLMRDLGDDKVSMRAWDLARDSRQGLQQAFDILSDAVRDEPWQWWLLPHAHALWCPNAEQASH